MFVAELMMGVTGPENFETPDRTLQSWAGTEQNLFSLISVLSGLRAKENINRYDKSEEVSESQNQDQKIVELQILTVQC